LSVLWDDNGNGLTDGLASRVAENTFGTFIPACDIGSPANHWLSGNISVHGRAEWTTS